MRSWRVFPFAFISIIPITGWGRAWRNGTTGHAFGVAGIPALWDRRGEADMFGKPLRVTEIGIADEIAAAASIVMGAAAERQPVVIVRGKAAKDMKNKEDFWDVLEVVPGEGLMQKPDAFGCKLGEYT